MIHARAHQPSLTPCGLNHGDTLHYRRADGGLVAIELLATAARVLEREYARYGYGATAGDCSAYGFSARLRINGEEVVVQREVGTPASFYEPLAIAGIHLWLDAVRAIFTDFGGFMAEKDWRHGWLCAPAHNARLAVQDAAASICPEPLALWCDLPRPALDIRDCYNGEDCWMGPYAGAQTHCGLDLNMPIGSRLYAPLSFDDQYYFHTVAAGFGNNRWRGVRRWADGSEWWLQAHHLIAPLVPERQPLARGTPYATTAGTAIGAHPHTHFMFRVLDRGGDYLLDPWLLFWQTFRDLRATPRTPAPEA
jgi:hypothetical protein